MGEDRGGGALAVPEQLADGGQAAAIHDGLRGVSVVGVSNADAARSGLLLYPDPAGPAARRAERRRRRANGMEASVQRGRGAD